MTYEKYKEELAKIEEAYLNKKNLLSIAFCNANNPYKIGDVFEDHIGKIEIETIRYSTRPLCCIYKGIELTKTGKPFKKMKKRVAFQSNDIKIQ
jgi:hypothetical protein